MKDISEKRLSDYMAEQIADEILSGRIPGGSQLKTGRTGGSIRSFQNPDPGSISDSGESGPDYPSGNQKNYRNRTG